MDVLFFCPMWGMSHLPLADTLERIKRAGYDGVEFGCVQDDHRKRDQLLALTESLGLITIGQQCFAGGADFRSYKKSFVSNLQWLASFGPMMINSHTGRDFYTYEENYELIMTAEEIAAGCGIDIIHETHRGRFSFSALQCLSYLERIPGLRFNADFSHFCVVSESYLEDQQEILQSIKQRSFHVHARVGHPQGPQVPDPRLPEWSLALQAHLGWWDDIVGIRKASGAGVVSFTPEFGPAPYMPTVPFTLQPVTSQWDVNLYMQQLLKSRYNTEP